MASGAWKGRMNRPDTWLHRPAQADASENPCQRRGRPHTAYRLRIPRVFAALVLISATGLAIFALLSFLSNRLLRNWHDSTRL